MKGHIRKRGKSSWAVMLDLGRDASGKRRHAAGKRRHAVPRSAVARIDHIEINSYFKASKYKPPWPLFVSAELVSFPLASIAEALQGEG